ncbi:MAG: tol-pal system protein YbgF, partial [Gammaproteobacteria bacterium]
MIALLTRPRVGMRVAAIVLVALSAAPVNAQQDPTAARLERIERLLDNKGLLELLRQVETLQQEVRQLRGELENQNFALEQLRKGQRDVYGNLDQRLATLEQAGVISLPAGGNGGVPTDPPLSTYIAPDDVSVAGTPAEEGIAVDLAPAGDEPMLPGGALDAAAEGAPAAGTGVPSEDIDGLAATTAPAATTTLRPPGASTDDAASEAAYRDAFGLLKAGQYEDSIAAFDAFLQQYPHSQYADNAQYWLGEAYYVMRQFEPAIEHYEKLVNGYPDSQKQSHALLKIAYSYSELGLDEQALSVLGTLKTRFPGSAAAR